MVDVKIINKAKKLVLSNFIKITDFSENKFQYKHSSGKISTIDLKLKYCSCIYMFDHGMCAHLVRAAIMERISLPGMEARIPLVTRQREKRSREEQEDDTSDEEFVNNLEQLETDSQTIEQGEAIVGNGHLGRPAQEIACTALARNCKKTLISVIKENEYI